MVRSIWRRSAGPGLVALAAVGLLASTTIGARERPWDPPTCAPTAGRLPLQAAVAQDGSDGPWLRLDPILDPDGALAGQRLVVGHTDRTGWRFLDLPPESSAAGPVDGVIVVATDDGSLSRVVALDVVAGCATTLDTSTDVIRRASIGPDGRTLVEVRVDRWSRADLGVWRRSIDDPAAATRWLAPIVPDTRFGRTWSTDLVWSTSGPELAIQTCGEVACRVRIVDPSTDIVRSLDGPDIGQAVGLADGRLVAYLACRGLPCPIVGLDVRTGARRTLVADAGPAVLTGSDVGPRLVHRTWNADGAGLRSVALDGTDDRSLGPVPDGFDLLTEVARSGAAVDRPVGWVVLAPAGRLPREPGIPDPLLRHVLDGRSAALDEVPR